MASETTVTFTACTTCNSSGMYFSGIQFFMFTNCGDANSKIAILKQLEGSNYNGSPNPPTVFNYGTPHLSAGTITNDGGNYCSEFILTGLTIGQTYYWGVDGYEGADCPYTIQFGDGIVLPVELTSFTGEARSTGNLLEWETASEKNNDYFTLYSSVNGTQWKELTQLEGAGNSQETLSYNFLDRQAGYGVTYYKLRQTDYDGKQKEFGIISVVRSMKEEIVVKPNPSNGNFQVSYFSNQKQTMDLVIYDNLGKVVYSKLETLDKGVNEIPVVLTQVKSGVYFIRTVVGGKVSTLKMVMN